MSQGKRRGVQGFLDSWSRIRQRASCRSNSSAVPLKQAHLVEQVFTDPKP